MTLGVPRLVEPRLLVQTNIGGDKSWRLRRLLEHTHRTVQELGLDPDGEFVTVRERYGHLLAATSGDGDCVAEPRSVHLLAQKLMALRVPAVLDA